MRFRLPSTSTSLPSSSVAALLMIVVPSPVKSEASLPDIFKVPVFAIEPFTLSAIAVVVPAFVRLPFITPCALNVPANTFTSPAMILFSETDTIEFALFRVIISPVAFVSFTSLK